ncbi:MAG TPA: hypothetical protein VGR02_12195 [Thermoanaerobaculia bacterium]|jgi:hypothetical protein|nr:hypothetical protein [Thermoanaerobaculia bacterium]
MTRYIQRIALVGKERWIGWEIDGVGTEIPGLTLAEHIPDEELRARGVKEFRPMSFESFLGLGAIVSTNPPVDRLLDEDVEFRLDALQVGLERIRSRGQTDVPRAVLANVFGADQHIEHPLVQARLREWARDGAVELVGGADCYLRITGRLA